MGVVVRSTTGSSKAVQMDPQQAVQMYPQQTLLNIHSKGLKNNRVFFPALSVPYNRERLRRRFRLQKGFTTDGISLDT